MDYNRKNNNEIFLYNNNCYMCSKATKKYKKSDKYLEALEKIEENYSIKIAQYTKDFYKQGFIDGVNLMINCIKQ